MSRSSNPVRVIGGIVLLVGFFSAVTVIAVSLRTGQEESQGDESEKSLWITLSVYSGRPNPQWELKPGPDYDRLISLVEALDVEAKALFEYDEWNRLGYASFWITLQDIEGLPYAIHVWRDMAYVVQNREETGEGLYALGATEIYDLLVTQAEERGQGAFFEKYRRHQEERES